MTDYSRDNEDNEDTVVIVGSGHIFYSHKDVENHIDSYTIFRYKPSFRYRVYTALKKVIRKVKKWFLVLK